MSLFPTKWLVMLAAAMAFSAPAQQTIILSKPADMSSDKANSFLPGSEHRAGSYNAPHQLFNDYTPDLPMPRPLLLDNDNASAKDAMNKRKNWTLLTPEQILGIQTPEEILKVPDRTGEKNLSLEEKFLLRESRAAVMTATNGRAGSAFARENDAASLFDEKKRNEENNPLRQSPQQMGMGTRYFNQLINANVQHSEAVPDEKNSSAWDSVFAQPIQPKPTPGQLADMERFRALMEPSSPPEQARYSQTTVPVPDPYLQAVPVVNPAGRAIAPLENGFAHPSGIMPLPGISTPPQKPVAAKPGWQAQPPPWMKNGPQPHNPSQNY